MTTIPAIETHFAGYRFRSRLEARWAVFFKTMGIDFRYEHEGYLVGERQRPYLPDFWLPSLGVWVEVKGDQADLDMSLMDDAVSYPSGLPKADPYGELCMLILGPIPDPGRAALHSMISRTVYAPSTEFCACKDLHFTQQAFVAFPKQAMDALEIKGASGEPLKSPGAMLMQVGRTLLTPSWEDIVTSRPHSRLVPDLRVADAYRAARQARFEHGETPNAA